MAGRISIEDIANNSGINVVELVKLMKTRGMNATYQINSSQEKEIHQVISESYSLGVEDKRKLWKLLTETDSGREIINEMAPFFGMGNDKKFVNAMAELILDRFGDQIKGINPDLGIEDIQRTIFNFGPKRFESIFGGNNDYEFRPNKALLRADPRLFYSLVQKTLRKQIERTTHNSYKKLVEETLDTADKIREFVIQNNSGNKVENGNLEELLNSTFTPLEEEVRNIAKFKEELDSRSSENLKPKWHQALRMYHLTNKNEQGEYLMERSVIADCTASGKTFSLLGSYGLLREQQIKSGKRTGLKALVISPKQAVHSVWGKINEKEDGTRDWDVNKYMRALGLPNLNLLRINSVDDLEKINDDVDVVLINYEKLALTSSDNGTGETQLEDSIDLRQSGMYLDGLLKRINKFSTFIVDEAHNLKNTRSKRSGSMIDLVEQSKGKHFLVSTATTIPNRAKDAGFILYMLDPKKFADYKDNVFDVREDRFSIPNMVNSSNWFRLELGDLKDIFGFKNLPYSYTKDDKKSLESKLVTSVSNRGIPVLEDEVPMIYEMDENVAKEYYNEWSNLDSKDVSILPQILLKGSIPYLSGLTKKLFEDDESSRVTLFTRHKKCFVDDMIESLVQQGINRYQIGIINGDESAEAREKTARGYEEGDIKVVLCSSQVSESFSLVSGGDKNYMVFAEPSFVPGVYEQALGRAYRPGQEGDVITIHPIPKSSWLESKMLEYKKEQETNNPEMKIRKTFTPTNFFEDAWTARLEKRYRNKLAEKHTGDLSLIQSSEFEEEDEISAFRGLDIHKAKREGSSPENGIKTFTRGFQSARPFQGRPVEELNKCSNLRKGYFVKDLMKSGDGSHVFPPKRVAGAIEQVIDVLSKVMQEKKGYGIERILDVGSGTAILARQLSNPIISLDFDGEMIEGGMQSLLVEKPGQGAIIYKSTENYDKDRNEVSGLLNKLDDNNVLLEANARKMPLDSESIDFISSSYAIMYNQQDFERRDIEEIFLEYNRVLKEGGYGLLTLPAETTRQTHKELYERMLKSYGFDVLFANYITDKVLAKKGRGAYSILFQKVEGKDEMIKEDPIEILYITERLVGGRASDRKRNTCFEENPRLTEGSDEYKVCERVSQRTGKKAMKILGSLQEYIYGIVSSK